MYSRRSKVEEIKNKKKTYIFIFLTIFSIVLLFFFGLPAVIKFAAFITEINKSTTPIETNDTTPPPPPKLSSLPLAVNNSSIEIRGNTEAGISVEVFLNEKSEEIISDSAGNFSVTVKLDKGENYIYARSTDTSGNESQKSDIQKVILDTEPPSLEISSPGDKTEFFGSRQRQVVIEGKTEEYSKVQINNRQAVVEAGGNFTYSTSLLEGENIFNITSEDGAGNKTETSFSVTFTP